MTSPKLSKRAISVLAVIARFERGQYRISERLSVSPRMWNVLIAAGVVRPERVNRDYVIAGDNGRAHLLTDAGWDIADAL